MQRASLFERFKSRKFLMAFGSQIVGLCVLVFPEYEADLTQAASNVMALLLMGLTAWGYIEAEGAVDAERAAAQGRQPDAAKPTPGSTRIGPVAILAMAGCLAFMSGCASTPEARWYQARDGLNAANRTYLATTPLLNDQQIVTYGELLQAARASLDTAQTHLPEGGAAFDAYLDIVEAILVKIQPEPPGKETSDHDSSPTTGRLPDRPGNSRLRPDTARTGPAGRHTHRGAEAGHPARSAAHRRPGGPGSSRCQGPHRSAGGVALYKIAA